MENKSFQLRVYVDFLRFLSRREVLIIPRLSRFRENYLLKDYLKVK